MVSARALALLASLCACGATTRPMAAQSSAPREALGTANIDVIASGFSDDGGEALVALFASEYGFPNRGDLAVRKETLTVNRRQIAVSFGDLAPGRYAVAILHDENANGAMDETMLGSPKEGYGISRNARGGFGGAPDFDDAMVEVEAGQTASLHIHIVYP